MDFISEHWNVIFGALFIVVGIALLIKGAYDRSTGTRCKDVITGFEKGERDTLFPIVKFTYEGEEYSMSTLNGSRKPKKGVGEETEVIYRPKNQKYVIEVGNYFDVLICAVVVVMGIVLVSTFFLG